MKSKTSSLIIEFIIKRAFRRGRVTRKEVSEAAGVSAATAARYLSRVGGPHGLYREVVTHDRSGVMPRPAAEPPTFAGEAALLKDLANGNQEVFHTGLYQNELPVFLVDRRDPLPLSPGILSEIVRAIRQTTPLSLVYLDKPADAQPSAHPILPLGLERLDGVWNLIAQSLDGEAPGTSLFVLSRVLKVSVDVERRRKLRAESAWDRERILYVKLSESLSEIQKKVLRHELRIRPGTRNPAHEEVRVPQRLLSGFKREFIETKDRPAPLILVMER